jgi:hypothetical protein
MKPFATITVILLGLVALLHLLRLWFGWTVTVDSTTIPMWASVVGLVIAAGLGVGLWRETRG